MRSHVQGHVTLALGSRSRVTFTLHVSLCLFELRDLGNLINKTNISASA